MDANLLGIRYAANRGQGSVAWEVHTKDQRTVWWPSEKEFKRCFKLLHPGRLEVDFADHEGSSSLVVMPTGVSKEIREAFVALLAAHMT